MGSLSLSVGDLASAIVADPGAGNEFTYTPTAGIRVKIISGTFLFTTDATVVNRSVYYEFIVSAVSMGILQHSTLQTATQARYYNLIPGYRDDPFAVGSQWVFPWDPNIQFDSTHSLRVNALNMQAGDAFINIALNIEQWIDD